MVLRACVNNSYLRVFVINVQKEPDHAQESEISVEP